MPGESSAFDTINKVGQSMSMIQAIIATVCFVSGVLIVVRLLFEKDNTVETQAVVTNVQCTTYLGNAGLKHGCMLTLTYFINGKEHSSDVLRNELDKEHYKGEKMTIYVNPADPTGTVHYVSPGAVTSGMAGAICCICTLCLAFHWGAYYFSTKVKGAGAGMLAVQGLSALAGR
jgi:hypothetical protein